MIDNRGKIFKGRLHNPHLTMFVDYEVVADTSVGVWAVRWTTLRNNCGLVLGNAEHYAYENNANLKRDLSEQMVL